MRAKKTTNKNDTSTKKRAAKVTNRKVPKTATKGIYNGLEYDSLDELGMLQWLFELKNQGFIKSIKRSMSYLLSDDLTNNFAEPVKKGNSSKPATQCLLRGHSYTAEFDICWDWTKAKDKFVWDQNSHTKFEKLFIGEFNRNHNEIATVIEVKPSFDQNNMERLFKLNQKWMWDKYKIFVNLVKINDLFPKTFVPKAYLTTPTGRPRVLKYKARTLFNYINNK